MKEVVRRNFDDSVSAYAAYDRRTGRFSALTRLLFAEMASRLDAAAPTVLDAGAGTGVSTQVLGESAARVVALDLSREMLLAGDWPDRVEGDFDQLPLADGTFDAVAYTASLFLVPDPAPALAEARRTLKPGGVVGAVAPAGWVDADGRDVFEPLERDSRSPTDAAALQAAFEDAFDTAAGTWSFPVTAAEMREFHAIPAMAARLYPSDPPAARVEKASDLLDAFEGTFEHRWRWVVGTAE
ncbi:class I SAM-dependent methyltransferase [Halobacteriales archaeon Cl-PHB]